MASVAGPRSRGKKPARKRFEADPIGVFHIDIAEVCTQEGRLYPFVAIDRTGKFAIEVGWKKWNPTFHRTE